VGATARLSRLPELVSLPQSTAGDQSLSLVIPMQVVDVVRYEPHQ